MNRKKGMREDSSMFERILTEEEEEDEDDAVS